MNAQKADWDKAMAGALLALWCCVVIWLRWGAWAPDLSAVVIAAHLWAEGARGLVYAAPEGFFGGAPSDWAPVMEALGISGRESFAYVYPPFWLALLAPMVEGASVQSVLNAGTLVQVPLLAVSVILAGRLAKPETWSWSRWSLYGVVVLSATLPAVHVLMHTQPTITMGFLILLAIERQAAGRPVLAGAALALAAAIKLSPALFVLVFLLHRDARALASFGLMGGALAGLSVMLAGWAAHLEFVQALGSVSGLTLLIGINVSLKAAFVGLGVLVGLWPVPDPLPAAVVTPGGLSLGVGVAGALLAWGAARRGPLAFVIALAVLVPLVGPLGWMHYYVLPLLLLPGILRLMPGRRGVLWVGVLLLAQAAPVFLALRGLAGFDLWSVGVLSALWLGLVGSLAMGRRAV